MGVLKREEWYDLARETNWTPRFVTEADLFPDEQSGSMGIPAEVWEHWDEPYKVTFPEYVETQREKDAGAYSVKAALARSTFFDDAPPGWKSALKAHYGAVALGEYAAATGEARMARFGRAPGNRNMAVFGMLDEVRHAQLQLWFPHELCPKDRQFDWAHKTYHTDEWGPVAARSVLDDLMMARSAVEIAIMITFAFETGFTNLQFLALAADATDAGDFNFATLISSIQTDESRHAQQGAPTLRILVEQGKRAEAQQLIDIAFWRSWRLFSLLTGISMDYYTPLEHRNLHYGPDPLRGASLRRRPVPGGPHPAAGSDGRAAVHGPRTRRDGRRRRQLPVDGDVSRSSPLRPCGRSGARLERDMSEV